jgi:GT2 family glycosyltransferase
LEDLPQAMSAGAGISIVYVTHRSAPHFEWFADSLARQADGDDFEVLFVDGLHSPERSARLVEIVRDRFAFRHLPPKPTPYNGPYRLTHNEYFAVASARNGGVVYATRPYVVFVDDASVLMPGWWQEVRTAAREGLVVAGAYQKHWEMVVENGVLLGSRVDPSGIDSRWSQGEEAGLVRIGGGQLYGCSFGAPRTLLRDVDGLDELCDVVGGEDYHLGIRLEWTGAPIYYSRRMLTIESEELHHEGPMLLRRDWTCAPESYMRTLGRFGVARRSVEGRCDASHMILDILYGLRSTRAVANYYSLAALTPTNLLDTIDCFPSDFWFDGRPLAEM